MSMRLKRALAVVFILALPAKAALAVPVTKLTLRPTAVEAAKNLPVTFGQVFRRGDIRGGVRAMVPGLPGISYQVDSKRKYDDGSLRFAVISLMIPELIGKTTVALDDSFDAQPAEPLPVQVTDLLETDFDATISLKFPDGTERSASARQLLQAAGKKPKTWLAGPLVTEWLLEGTPVSRDGKPDPDLRVQFHVRAYAGCKAVRVAIVVENCLDHWAGNIGYDTTVTLGKDSRAVYRKKDVDHRRLSRWRKDFWWPAEPPPVHVEHDFAYLSASGAIPNYDRTITIPEEALADLAARWAKSTETDVMGSGSLCKYMPTTGLRPEIAPYPQWTVQYLLTMDPRTKAIVLGNGDLAGSWPIHVRSAKTGRILTLNQRPKFWLSGYRAEDKERPLWQPDRKTPPPRRMADGKSHPYYLSPDVAHVGSFAYVPYLVSGDFYYLEEAYFWGNCALLSQWPVPRQDAKGIMSDQIRGNAWGLRNIADAAFVAPDGDPEAEYFDERIHNNLAALNAKMYGPPEYNKLGFWGPRTVANARIHDAANPQWIITAPWEHDFLIWSLHHLTELGWADAAGPRDFELRWRVSAFLHPNQYDPRLAAPYRMVVGQMGPDKNIVFYDDWKKLGEENAKLTKLPEGERPKMDYDYSANIALVCGVDAGFPRAAEALAVLLDKTGGFHGILKSPGWRIVPRNTSTR